MSSIVRGVSNSVGGVVGDLVGSFTSAAGADVPIPQMSPEERALLAEQTSMLRDQRGQLSGALREQDLLRPLLLEDLGLEAVMGGRHGNQVVGYRRTGPQAEINQLMQNRTLQALRGELPVSSAFEQDREEQRRTLGEVMARNLGPGWETSTPGMNALTRFDAETATMREGIREGQLTSNEALLNNRSNRTFGQVMGVGSAPLPFINSGLNLTNTFSGPLSTLANDRNMATQAHAANASTRMGALSGVFQGAGYAFGGGFGG